MRKQILLVLCALSLLSCGSGTAASVRAEGNLSEAAIGEQKEAQPTENTVLVPQEAKEASSFYRTVSLYGGKLKVSVPVSFTEMSAAKIAIKYPNAGNRPNVVYTNERASVNVTFTQVAMPTEQEDLPEVKEVLSQQLQAVKPMNFQSRIEKINGFDYAVFEFESQALDSRIYNLMFATDVDGKLLIGTFNCTEALKEEWHLRAKEIFSLIRKG